MVDAPPTETYVALLRAVNVAGHGSVAMTDLRALLGELGFADPRSLLQTGNLVFRAAPGPAAELEPQLERAIEQRLGLRTDVMARTAVEWEAVIAGNPFPSEAERDPGHLVVMALKEAPTPARVAALRAAIVGPERVEPGARHLYIVYPDGIGRSKLTVALIEKHLATRGTGRNWNTVRKLAALARS